MITAASDLFDGVPDEIDVWMSHGDQVTAVAERFRAAGQHRAPVRSPRSSTVSCRSSACSSIPK